MHIACRKRYSDNRIEGGASSSSNLPPPFDFEKNCFICIELADRNQCWRRKTVEVRKRSLHINILNVLITRCNEFAKIVIERIGLVEGLSASRAIYHDDCSKSLHSTNLMVQRSSSTKHLSKILKNVN